MNRSNAQLVEVIERTGVEEAGTVSFDLSEGRGALELPAKFVEWLSCGCYREVRLTENSSSSADVVAPRWARISLRDPSKFDTLKDLRPSKRYCAAHFVSDDRLPKKRIKEFSEALQARAIRRGSKFERTVSSRILAPRSDPMWRDIDLVSGHKMDSDRVKRFSQQLRKRAKERGDNFEQTVCQSYSKGREDDE